MRIFIPSAISISKPGKSHPKSYEQGIHLIKPMKKKALLGKAPTSSNRSTLIDGCPNLADHPLIVHGHNEEVVHRKTAGIKLGDSIDFCCRVFNGA
ncbi:hypothetical protein JTE90_011045 [Oedothorax gibbosus]|uniref:Uncharacterized protein n=1 Tax=Oedothorax gibbosus TaxID=931172 RepID=A0AAV6VE21_9ARAC|nr:hypothetical protein JTE90_011045 [Oedothorax gibbosus]